MPADAPVAAAVPHVTADLLAAVRLAVAEAVAQPKPKLTRQPWLYVGLPKSTWYRLASEGRTPKAVSLEGTGKHYRTEELDRWVERMRTA